MNFKGKTQRVHRIAYEFYFGPIPIGAWVLHHCDNRRCVNPEHFFLGNAQINVDDKMAKGRHGGARGEQISPIPADCIPFIRASHFASKTLALLFGVGRNTIWNIRTGKTWKHL